MGITIRDTTVTSNSGDSRRPDFEILTVVCTEGPAPLTQRLEVPVRSGLNALYGRNGAGKTRLLKAIRETISGDRADAQVIVRPRDEGNLVEAIAAVHEQWLGDFERGDLEQHFGELPWRHGSRTVTDAVIGDVILERWTYSGAWSGWGSDHEGRPSPVAVVDEILQNMGWALQNTSEGEWDLIVTMRISETTPLLASLRQRLVNEWDAALSEVPEGYDLYETEVAESVAQAVEQYGGRLSRGDFFTVLGPLPDPTDAQEYDGELANISTPGALLCVAQVCSRVATGALCELRTDEELLPFEMFSQATVKAIRTWGRHEHVAQLNRDGAADGDIFLAEIHGEGLSMVDPSDTGAQVAAWVAEPVGELVESVNSLLTSMLPEAPTLDCSVAEPERWADSEPCQWVAIDPTGTKVQPDQLSGAQTYLVRVAFTLAVDRYRRRFEIPPPGKAVVAPALVLLDEPEAGLHRLAEDTLTEALDDYGRRNDLAVIAATHSSAFLRNPRVALVEVFRRANGWTSVRSVEFPDQAGIDALGISRAELLQLYQLILLVEGHHEQLIFGEMLGKELGRRRALPVPLRGMFNLNAIVDLEILAHTLEQPVLAVLDNANAEAIDRLWAELKALPEGSGVQDARPVLEECLGPAKERTDEEKQIASLAENLLKSNQLDRFEVYGLSRGDIIEYLPVERLVPAATSWDELRQEHEQAKTDAPGKTAKDFKKWLGGTHHADFGDDAMLLAAAVAAESPPEEFLVLLSRIDSIVGGWTR